MSHKRLLVLSELAALCGHHHRVEQDGFWRPFHVRYFRTDSPLREAGVSLNATVTQLRRLARDGLCERRYCGHTVCYRINDAGHVALARAREADRGR